MELLEREQFLAELNAIHDDVVSGNGRLVLVSGEAGIGKSSLVEAFAAGKERVLWGACDALFTPRPLGPLYDIAVQAQDKLLTLLDEEAPRASIFSAFLTELQNEKSPSLVVIEDVHWADESTLDLLLFLGRRLNRINSMVIVTFRDDQVAADHPLRVVLGDLPHRSVARLRLQLLSEASVDALAEKAGRRIEDLYRVTGGNPFFVTEALASTEPGVPVTVSDAVLGRISRLSPEARDVVELVSVVPAKAEYWLVSETIGPSATVLEECISSGILRNDGEALAFRHELARRAVEDSLAVPRRHDLHARVLKILLDRWAESLLPRIVHHAAQAHDIPRVLQYAPMAARQAAALDAHREAASHYGTALMYAGEMTPKERAALLELRSYEFYVSGQIEEAFNTRSEAVDLYNQLGDDLRRGDNVRWLSRLSWGVGRREDAERYAHEAVAILNNLAPTPELAMAYSTLCQLHMFVQEDEEVVLWGKRAIELAQQLGDTETLLHALNNVGTVEWFAFNDDGRIKLEESLRLALSNNLHEHAARAYANLAYVTIKNRRYDVASSYLKDGIAYATQHDLFYKLHLTASRGRMYFDKGEWDLAADDADFVLGHHRLPWITKLSALAVLGYLRVRRGDPDAARLLNEAHDLAVRMKELQRIAPIASARAEYTWLNGEREQLRTEARSMLDIATGHKDPWIQEEFAFWLWRAGVEPDSPQVGVTPFSLQRMGDWQAAANAWKQFRCPYEEAMALADGDQAAQRSALEILETLGARPAAEYVRQKLRTSGVRIPRGPRPSTKQNAAGLTRRQTEILKLLIDGLTNSEIGDRLFISSRTVDHHVGAILAKLDARTRAEAVSKALQTGLLPN